MRRAFGDGRRDARPHRRPEAGDLRLPRRRRLRVPRGGPGGRRPRATLDVNWRSDQGLIDAYDALFGGARLGHEGIVYRHVRGRAAATRRRGSPARPSARRCASASSTATTRALEAHARRLRVSNASAREHIASDLARRPRRRCCRPSAQIEIRGDGGRPVRRERVRPGHVAVLVRTHRNAALVRDALEAAGIPAVINGAGSVFGTTPGARLAAAAGGARAPVARAPRARGGADAVPRLERAGRWRPPTRRRCEELHRRLHALGAGAAHARGRGADRDDDARRGPARARAARRRTASGA